MNADIITPLCDYQKWECSNDYLKVTGFKVGLLINFKHAKLEWNRVARSI